MEFFFEPGLIEAADEAALVVVLGPPGCGRTTAARAVARRCGGGDWALREFGRLQYTDIKGLRRSLRALSARKGGGLLVQMGAVAGMCAVFDDAHTAPRAAQRAIVEFAAAASRRLRVVIVARSAASVAGLRRRLRAARTQARTVVVGRPTDAQLARMPGGAPDAVRSLSGSDRADFRSAGAALGRLAAARTSAADALVAGGGVRDRRWGGETPEALARAAMDGALPLAERERAAAAAPYSVGAILGANLGKVVRSRRARIEYARCLGFAARCRAQNFDETAQLAGLYAGTLAAPMLRDGAAGTVGSLVGSGLLSVQARYNRARQPSVPGEGGADE